MTRRSKVATSPTWSSSTAPTSPPRAARHRACASSTRRCGRTGTSSPTPSSRWSSTPRSGTASTRRRSAEFDDGDRQQRARRPAGRRDRPRRRLRAEHRQQGRRPRAEQRLVPGVPRGLPVAVRRRPADRRQAGAPHRLGLRRAAAGQGSGQPQGAARRAPRRPSRRPGAVRRARRPASRCPCRRHRRPAAGAPPRRPPRRAPATDATGRAVGASAVGSDRQRRAAVPRLRRAPSGRQQRQRGRRVLLVARRRT